MKADLDKAELERDALLDALQESRAALDDVRGQRDLIESELRDERASSRQLKKVRPLRHLVLSYDSDGCPL
jgi:predicted  nucleic acid-binding Zn-ribbon protein